jgi:DeoR/GlpR family transcriptional regulator of sugar metabolism
MNSEFKAILAEIRQLRQDLKASRSKLLTVDDLAQEMALSPKTIRNQLSAGTFPIRAVRSAGGVRFTRMSVEDYVRRLGEAE